MSSWQAGLAPNCARPWRCPASPLTGAAGSATAGSAVGREELANLFHHNRCFLRSEKSDVRATLDDVFGCNSQFVPVCEDHVGP